MRHLLALTSLFVLFSCGNKSTDVSNDSASADSTKVLSNANSDWHELTESWNESLNLRNASIMKSFYADSVDYYGDQLTNEEVVRRQQEYFNRNIDYKQRIEEYVELIKQPDGTWLVKIMKEVTANGKTATYPASVVFTQVKGIWKITAESDDITDLNKAKNIEVSYSPVTTTVEGLVEENNTYGIASGGDAKSDARITYYVIWSKNPLNVRATAKEDLNDWKEELNVERIQLVGHSEEIKKLLNRKVRITGKLEPANSVDHHTNVILNVDLVEEAL